MAAALETGETLVSLMPVDARSDCAPHAHEVQFYEADASLLEEVGRFVGAALGSGAAALVLATEAHHDALTARLATRGLDMARVVEEGRYVAVDAAEALAQVLTDEQPDAERFAELIGGLLDRAQAAAGDDHPPVAVYGELVALLFADGRPDAAIRLEQLWNDLARSRTFNLHCGYPLAVFDRAADGVFVERICAAHSRVLPGESYTALTDEDARLRAIAVLQQKALALEAEVAARARAQEALTERNRELAEALAARDAFVAAVTHDLKTPLAGIHGFTQLLQRQVRRAGIPGGERLLDGLREIDQATIKMRQQIDQLLDVAHLQAGRPLDLERRPTDLVALARGCIGEYRASAERHRLILESDVPELVGDWDGVRLERLLGNLLSNAIKYSPHGGDIVVAIRRERDDTGDWAVLTVRDHGIGIPEADRRSIFERFQRATNVVGRITGTGIGLASARQIAAEHGGSIGVESREGVGSTFTARLPLSATTAPAASEARP